ncbi:hypothetical protein PLEOSDRAFT_1105530 [Pleurotus ostreatus PC15]|uniref:F-box protein Hrt3/FBXO9 C-terminal domain-containing protein n=1 Tax=Pleurotus ostreatus (strain PC15) TaxID=1137138 RepID=A0A067NSM7_PLEO1|nr:hypothetical protein PLEOSDRAFT_1105530 [Pleurotus ostreatus PC15]
MDNTTIGCFAQVGRKAWRRDLVVSTYKPPQISSLTELVPIIERHGHDYRRVYIEQPRDRQPGLTLSENQYMFSPFTSHLITYNRYLRFFPDGRVLSLLVNEEYAPQQMIPLLRNNSRMKGLLAANGVPPMLAAVLDDHLTSSSTIKPSKCHAHVHETSNTSTAREASHYVFIMSLSLRSRPVTGKWRRGMCSL